MKTTTKPARPEMTPAQVADKATIIAKVREIMSAQYSGNIKDAQGNYEWLMGWCEAKGYDFGTMYEGALRSCQKTACGMHDTAAYQGARLAAT